MLYKLTRISNWEEEIKRSRFVVYAGPVDTTEAALKFIEKYSVAEATHNCWAYSIGDEYRFNDDGEPGGTAGRPILQAIHGQQIDYAVVLVIRWFGGIKLGTGGLVRAYGGAAAQCLRVADKRKLVPMVTISCHCPFSYISIIQARMDEYDISINAEQFNADGVIWELAVPEANLEDYINAFTNITRGQGVINNEPAV